MLDSTSIEILKLLKSKGSLDPVEIDNYIKLKSRSYIPDHIGRLEELGYIMNLRGDRVNTLDDYGKIVCLEVTKDWYKLMPPGKAYLENYFRDKIRFWIPITISVIALLKSFDRQLITFLNLVIKLLSSSQ